MPITFGQLKSETRARLFPKGEARSLVSSHDKDFVDCLTELQTFVECLQQDNTSVIPHCATFYNCGLTVLEAPRGNIKRVEVIDKAQELSSGVITASKTGNTVVASADFFDRSMVGAQIRFADNQTFTIAVYVNPTTILVFDPEDSANIYLGGNARINAAGNLELFDPDDGLWHEVTLAGGTNDVQIAINQQGHP